MRLRGTRSWRFAYDIGQTPHALLFTRDSLRLPAGTGPGLPPRLTGEVPDLAARLDEGTRQEAGQQWPDWWRRVLAQDASGHLAVPGAGHDQWTRETMQREAMRRETMQGRRDVIDPPEWASLAGRPAIRAAARACFIEGCRWADARLSPLRRRGDGPVFEWHVVRDAAESAAAVLDVDTGEINGCALVLAVDGSWHELVAPGVAACSVSDAVDPVIAAAVLREVFTSWVTR